MSQNLRYFRARKPSINNILLNSEIDSLLNNISSKLKTFSQNELSTGVLIEDNGLLIGISDNRISYLSLERGGFSTQKGLKLSDTRQKALDTYGVPDKGFLNDESGLLLCLQERRGAGDNLLVLLDSLHIEFDGDKVSKIWMNSHVTAF